MTLDPAKATLPMVHAKDTVKSALLRYGIGQLLHHPNTVLIVDVNHPAAGITEHLLTGNADQAFGLRCDEGTIECR